MKKIPPFWRRFQMLARPTVYWADRRLQALVRRGALTTSQARRIAAQMRAA